MVKDYSILKNKEERDTRKCYRCIPTFHNQFSWVTVKTILLWQRQTYGIQEINQLEQLSSLVLRFRLNLLILVILLWLRFSRRSWLQPSNPWTEAITFHDASTQARCVLSRHKIPSILLCCVKTKPIVKWNHPWEAIQGGPKITERHTSGNNCKKWLVSVDGLSSPEKNYTKISHFGWVVLILEHVMSANVGLQNFPFSGKTSPKKNGTINVF